MWPDDRIESLFGIELPIIQAPKAGVAFSDMAIGVSDPATAAAHDDQAKQLCSAWRKRSDVLGCLADHVRREGG
jgi:NAD(P)H-dependent flavin oxidoreductase YrpB (nitropropane dioxygenase family)